MHTSQGGGHRRLLQAERLRCRSRRRCRCPPAGSRCRPSARSGGGTRPPSRARGPRGPSGGGQSGQLAVQLAATSLTRSLFEHVASCVHSPRSQYVTVWVAILTLTVWPHSPRLLDGQRMIRRRRRRRKARLSTATRRIRMWPHRPRPQARQRVCRPTLPCHSSVATFAKSHRKIPIYCTHSLCTSWKDAHSLYIHRQLFLSVVCIS